MKASFDITFVPMTNVTADVKDPFNPTEEEQSAIAGLAIEKIRENFSEKISCENLAEIRLHEIEGKETEKTVFDGGMLRQSSNPIEEALHLLKGLAKSPYIPFASPFPSSTEKILKDSVLEAISQLSRARQAEKDLHY